MMSAGLVAFVGILYAYIAADIAAEQFYLDNPSMGVCYAGYAFSNVGMRFLVK